MNFSVAWKINSLYSDIRHSLPFLVSLDFVLARILRVMNPEARTGYSIHRVTRHMAWYCASANTLNK